MENLNEKLANLIFPEITETIEDLEKRFPKRNLEEGAMVTRFAPSPTGFLHIGGLFGALIDMMYMLSGYQQISQQQHCYDDESHSDDYLRFDEMDYFTFSLQGRHSGRPSAE